MRACIRAGGDWKAFDQRQISLFLAEKKTYLPLVMYSRVSGLSLVTSKFGRYKRQPTDTAIHDQRQISLFLSKKKTYLPLVECLPVTSRSYARTHACTNATFMIVTIRYSRKIMWLKIGTTNNDPKVILLYYLSGTLFCDGTVTTYCQSCISSL